MKRCLGNSLLPHNSRPFPRFRNQLNWSNFYACLSLVIFSLIFLRGLANATLSIEIVLQDVMFSSVGTVSEYTHYLARCMNHFSGAVAFMT